MKTNEIEEKLLLSLAQKVTSADTDFIGRLRVGALVNFLIQGAIESADRLGFGFDDLRSQNLFWVLNRLTVEIDHSLMWNEEFCVETWPKDLEKILYIRDFLIKNEHGLEIVKATSGWLAVDAEKKRPKLVETKNQSYFNRLSKVHAIDTLPEKLTGISDGEEFVVETEFSDLDLNGHVTTTRYLDWMMNSFSTDFHCNNYPSRIVLNFIKETFPNEIVIIKRTENEKNTFQFEGLHKSSGAIAFRGYIRF